MFRTALIWFGIAGIGFLCAMARAALPPLKEEDRKRLATEILEGKVRSIDSDDKKGDKAGHEDTIYSIEIEVAKVIKGDNVKTGDTIKATTWKLKSRPDSRPQPTGQDSVPNKGDQIIVYIRKEAGQYQLLMPNGWDPAKPKEK